MDPAKNTVDDLTLTPIVPVEFIPGCNLVMEWGRGFQSWLWSPEFWLPKGYTWSDIASTTEKQYPVFQDVLTYPIIIGTVIYITRFFVLNPFVFTPFANWAGLKYRSKKLPARNVLLEKIFIKSSGKVRDEDICSAASSLQWSKRQVERWLRQRVDCGKINKLDKFQESGFIALYHIIASLFALYFMMGKPWLREISYTWIDYPLHEIENVEWWYYVISVSFYWALCFTHLRGGPADYMHHMFTILLLIFSWAVNLVRVGTLILLVHECGDIMLQIGKMCQYLKKKKATERVLGIFFVVWVTTRMVIFPFWIFRNMYFEAPKYVFMPAAYVLYSLLFGLLLLNVFWTCLIIAIIVKSVFKGEEVNDIRSSESHISTDDDGENKKVK